MIDCINVMWCDTVVGPMHNSNAKTLLSACAPPLRHDPRGRDGVPPMYRIGKERPHVWVTDPARSIVLEVRRASPCPLDTAGEVRRAIPAAAESYGRWEGRGADPGRGVGGDGGRAASGQP